jgi:Nickel responsive protein SCO4226-like
MPIYMVERGYDEDLEVTPEAAAQVNQINSEEGVTWLYSFLSADRRRTYCLYEGPSPDHIRRAAARAGLPADLIVEVIDKVGADGSLTPVGH